MDKIPIDCLAPLQSLVMNQPAWMTYHESWLAFAALLALTGTAVFLFEASKVIDWDGFGRTLGVTLVIAALLTFGCNLYWYTIATTNPAYYTYTLCPERFVPSEGIPVPGPPMGDLR